MTPELKLTGGAGRPYSWKFCLGKRLLVTGPKSKTYEEMRKALVEFLREVKKDVYVVYDETKKAAPRKAKRAHARKHS